MTQIKDYVLLLVGACFVCGGLTILAPNGRFERIIQVIGSIFLLLCMLSPLTGTVKSISDYDRDTDWLNTSYSTSDSWEYSAQAMSQALEETINSQVATVTGHNAQNIAVVINHNTHNFTLTDIKITISAEDESKKSAIVDYVAMKTGVKPTVISQSIGE